MCISEFIIESEEWFTGFQFESELCRLFIDEQPATISALMDASVDTPGPVQRHEPGLPYAA